MSYLQRKAATSAPNHAAIDERRVAVAVHGEVALAKLAVEREAVVCWAFGSTFFEDICQVTLLKTYLSGGTKLSFCSSTIS